MFRGARDFAAVLADPSRLPLLYSRFVAYWWVATILQVLFGLRVMQAQLKGEGSLGDFSPKASDRVLHCGFLSGGSHGAAFLSSPVGGVTVCWSSVFVRSGNFA